MQPAVPPEAARAFTELAELVYGETDPEQALEAIVRIAVQVMPGADHVTISTLESNAQLRTRAASDDIARLMDRLESDSHEGPCLDSIVKDSVQRDDDIASHSTWPNLARLTLEQTPVRGMVGYRLLSGLSGRSALNVFSDTPGALTPDAADVGAVLAAFTSVALAAVEGRATAESLRRGLESNREIGKAVGLLMAAHGVSGEEAFEILRKASSRTNTRLALIAERITKSHQRRDDG
ncbi:ANTAR domain-containing protein [Pedococcus sp. 5OH_020]|uniref:ANTAR domain-containing protein n=1 Tax=Pedococcus sp. 5OH_020 TaxID=2989814 RepID=UPI0022E9B39D|nr:ANTAR domain-containing protein [Pedococcus sp. 5OH_020]